MVDRSAVFVSSTSIDLKDHRIAVRDTLISQGYVPIMMEDFPAMDANAVDACMRKVDESDAYIGIFAHRYGFCPEGQSISITEMEFNRATSRDIPRLCFVVDKEYAWTPKFIDEGDDKKRLEAFKGRIDKNLIRSVFSTPDSLQVQVLKALGGLKLKPKPSQDRIDTENIDENAAQKYLKRKLESKYQFHGRILELIPGDITRTATDVLVSSDDNNLTMSSGVAQALANAAGVHWLHREREKFTGLKIGDVAVTSAGNLRAKYIFHPVTIEYVGRLDFEPPQEQYIQAATLKCLRIADALGMSSIAFPALGTGSAKFPPQTAASPMIRTICDYMFGETGLEEVLIVVYPESPDNLKAFFRLIFDIITRSRMLLTDITALKGSKELPEAQLSQLEAGIKEAMHILSETPDSFEDFERLKTESKIDQLEQDIAAIKKLLK